MMNRLAWLLMVYVAFVFEATGIGAAATGVEPRWLLLASAALLWSQRLPEAVIWAGLCGFLADVLGGGPLGIGLTIYSAAACVLGWLRRSRRWQSTVSRLLLTFVYTSLCVAGLNVWTALALPTTTDGWRSIGLLACGQGAMTALWDAGLGLAAIWVTTTGRHLATALSLRRSPARDSIARGG